MTIPENKTYRRQCTTEGDRLLGKIDPDLSLGGDKAGITVQRDAAKPPRNISLSRPDRVVTLRSESAIPSNSDVGELDTANDPSFEMKPNASEFFMKFPNHVRCRQPMLISFLRPVISLTLKDEFGNALDTFNWDMKELSPESGRFHLAGRKCRILPLWIIIHKPYGRSMTFLTNRDILSSDTPLYLVHINPEIDSCTSESSRAARKMLDGISSKKVILVPRGMDEHEKLSYELSRKNESRCYTEDVLSGINLLLQSVSMIVTTDKPITLDTAVPSEFLIQEAFKLPDAVTRQRLWDVLIHGDVRKEFDSMVLTQLSNGLSYADITKIGMSARSHCFESVANIPWPELLQCVINSRIEKPKLVTNRDISPSETEKLREMLRQRTNMSDRQICSVLRK